MEINITLAALFVSYYERIKRQGRTYIPDTEVAKLILLPMYEKSGITKIENLPKEIKRDLVRECREMDREYTNKTLIENCKILHLIKFIKNGTTINAGSM